MSIRFIYFDVGNVLLHFDNHRLCRQVAELTGVSAEIIWRTFVETELAERFETGLIDPHVFYEEFCRAIGRRPDYDQLVHALSDIFTVNAPIKPIVAHLWASGHRLGLLSNTNELHWDFFADGRYEMIPGCFEVHALSFRIQAMKPDPKIYRAAAEMAGVAPPEIFFMDDRPENVASAKQFGFDAVQFGPHAAAASQLAEQLRRRGIELNY